MKKSSKFEILWKNNSALLAVHLKGRGKAVPPRFESFPSLMNRAASCRAQIPARTRLISGVEQLLPGPICRDTSQMLGTSPGCPSEPQ